MSHLPPFVFRQRLTKLPRLPLTSVAQAGIVSPLHSFAPASQVLFCSPDVPTMLFFQKPSVLGLTQFQLPGVVVVKA